MQSLEEFLHVLYQWQWLPVLTVLLVTYVTYYLFHVVQKPRLIGKEGPFREFLLQSCPMVNEYYWPTFWCFGARAQTVIRAVIRSKPSVPFRRYFVHCFFLEVNNNSSWALVTIHCVLVALLIKIDTHQSTNIVINKSRSQSVKWLSISIDFWSESSFFWDLLTTGR